MHKVLWPLLIIVSLLSSCSDDDFGYTPRIMELDGVKVYVAKYYDNKEAVVSLTWDDGSRGQYEYAAPQLEKRNLPATFFINGSFIQPITCPEDDHMDSLYLKDMVERGFEVSNHTWSHVNLTTIPLDSVRKELKRNDDAIERWTGVRPTTMSFPNNARTKTLINVAMEDRVGVRTFEEGFGQSFRHSSYKDMKNWANDVIEHRRWGVAMLHAIDRGYDHWEDPNELWLFFDYLANNRDRLWIANFRDAVSYITERNNSTLELHKNDRGEIYAFLSTTLDTNLYVQPLTLIVEYDGIKQYVDIKPNTTAVVYNMQ